MASPHGPIAGEDHVPAAHGQFQGWRDDLRRAVPCAAFPIVRDLLVDRSAFDRMVQVGGYVSAARGGAPDGNALLDAEGSSRTGDGRGGVHRLRRVRGGVPEHAARLFAGAKLWQLALLPQGQAERACGRDMVGQMDAEGFGNCSNEDECEAVCPKLIPISNISTDGEGVHTRPVEGARLA